MADEAVDFQDWELLLPSPTSAVAGTAEPYAAGDDDDAAAIMHDYFDLASGAKYSKRASVPKEDSSGEEDVLVASGNPSWVEPGPDDLAFPDRGRAAVWSDTSSDGESRALEPVEQVEPLERPEEVEATAKEVVRKGAGEGGEGGLVRWWKLPFEVVRIWALRMARSAWSVPVAVALLGIAVLGRRLYRMRRQSKAVARVRLVLDEKKTSQFKAQTSRLNESISMVSRGPIIKPPLPANGVTPWPALGYL